MAHVSGNATWTNTSSTPVTAATQENIESQLDYVRPWIDSLWLPGDNGLVGWSYDPRHASTATNCGVNAFFSFTIKVGQTATATGLNYYVASAGSGAVSGNNWLGLYAPSSYTLVASTADMSTTWNSTGIKTTPFTSTVTVTPGTYAVGLISDWSTTNPTFQSSAMNQSIANLGRTIFHGGFTTGTFVTLPSSRPAASGTIAPIWFGLY